MNRWEDRAVAISPSLPFSLPFLFPFPSFPSSHLPPSSHSLAPRRVPLPPWGPLSCDVCPCYISPQQGKPTTSIRGGRTKRESRLTEATGMGSWVFFSPLFLSTCALSSRFWPPFNDGHARSLTLPTQTIRPMLPASPLIPQGSHACCCAACKSFCIWLG